MTVTDIDTHAHRGFLLSEEAALKRYLSGITVPDAKGNAMPVDVWFRWPESERKITYPFLTIDLLSITPAYDRWHSYVNEFLTPAIFEDRDTGTSTEGHYYPSTTANAAPNDESDYHTSNYLPYNIMFQVSSWARTALHDRYLTARFMTDIFPPRSFFIGDQTDQVWKRAELLEWISGDSLETTEAAKRQFRKIYTLNMEAEIPTSQILELVKVDTLHVDIYDDTQTPLLPGHASSTHNSGSFNQTLHDSNTIDTFDTTSQ